MTRLTIALKENSDTVWLVSGSMDCAMVETSRRDGHCDIIGTVPEMIFDLSGVTRGDSAGVALLVDWLRRAVQRDCRLLFSQVPSAMRDIIRVSGLDKVLPIID